MKPLKNNSEYLRTLKRFEEIFNAKKGTKESKEADNLSVLISAYEKEHFNISPLKTPKPKKLGRKKMKRGNARTEQRWLTGSKKEFKDLDDVMKKNPEMKSGSNLFWHLFYQEYPWFKINE